MSFSTQKHVRNEIEVLGSGVKFCNKNSEPL